MNIKLQDLFDHSFKSGAIIGLANQSFETHNYEEVEEKIHIKRIEKHISDNAATIKLSLKNISSDSQILNSFIIADFVIPQNPETILENGWQQCSFTGYRNGIVPSKFKNIFLKRDQNVNSFNQAYGYLKNSLVSEWFSQINFINSSLMIGAITIKNQFTQIFIKKEGAKTRIRVTCQLDGIILNPGEVIQSEEILFAAGDIETTLQTFAEITKHKNNIKIKDKVPKGICCAYYAQGNTVNEAYVIKQINILKEIGMAKNLEYVLIDAGYSVFGDWLDTSTMFPSGLESIVKRINNNGLKAGIWIAPFAASPNSELFKHHKDWFITDSSGEYVEARNSSPFDFLPFLSMRALDPTHPNVQDYLKNVIGQFVDYGFELIKIDFTYTACMFKNYYQDATRAEALRMGLEVIKNAAGDKVHILSGITPLSSMVGIADSVRTGLDTINPFMNNIPVLKGMVNNFMVNEDLRNTEARQFLNKQLWIADADCLISNPITGLAKALLNRDFDFLRKYGGSIWLGDDLSKLSEYEMKTYVLPLLSKKDV